MGANERTPQGNIYSLKHGCICQTSKQPAKGFDEYHYKDKDGAEKVTWIKRYGNLTGFITKLEWYSTEWEGRKLSGFRVHMADTEGWRGQFSINLGSRVFSHFCKIAPNIDFHQEVAVSAWNNAENQLTLGIKQNGENLKWYWHKDDPGDLPPPKKLRSGKWDFNDQEEFLIQYLCDEIIPAIESANQHRGPLSEAAGDEPEYDDTPDEEELQEAPRTRQRFAEESTQKPLIPRESMKEALGGKGRDSHPDDEDDAPPRGKARSTGHRKTNQFGGGGPAAVEDDDIPF